MIIGIFNKEIFELEFSVFFAFIYICLFNCMCKYRDTFICSSVFKCLFILSFFQSFIFFIVIKFT